MVINTEMGVKYQYLFISKQRKVRVEELEQGEAFVDAMFGHQNVYLMDIDEHLDSDPETGRVQPGKSGLDAIAGSWAVVPGNC